MAGQTIEAHTAFGAGGGRVGPPGFLQASRKAFNAIKEFLASEPVFAIHNLALGPSPWGQGCVVPSPPGMCAWGAIQAWGRRRALPAADIC